MPEKTFLVLLKTREIQEVRAASVEMYGLHLAFLTSNGKLAALFLMELVESYREVGS
jgi:hypothetical protein